MVTGPVNRAIFSRSPESAVCADAVEPEKKHVTHAAASATKNRRGMAHWTEPPRRWFRTNLHMQRGQLAATIRPVPKKITGFEDLNLPTAVKNLTQLERGLLLVALSLRPRDATNRRHDRHRRDGNEKF